MTPDQLYYTGLRGGEEKMYKKIMKYMRAHPMYNSTIHVLAGMGIGALITYPYLLPHPVRWGVVLLALGVAGHLYPLVTRRS